MTPLDRARVAAIQGRTTSAVDRDDVLWLCTLANQLAHDLHQSQDRQAALFTAIWRHYRQACNDAFGARNGDLWRAAGINPTGATIDQGG